MTSAVRGREFVQKQSIVGCVSVTVTRGEGVQNPKIFGHYSIWLKGTISTTHSISVIDKLKDKLWLFESETHCDIGNLNQRSLQWLGLRDEG